MSTETTAEISDGAESVADALGRITESELGGDAKTAAFVGALMSENYRQYAATTQTLLDNLQQENEELRATLETVRARVERLLNGPYMPTPAAILAALWSSPTTHPEKEDQQ